MAKSNYVLLIGNLTAPPELRQGQGGEYATMRLAVNKRYQDHETQEWKNGEAKFFNLVA
jgi:single-stranded DNA-binding protein